MLASSQPSAPNLFRVDVTPPSSVVLAPAHWYSHRVGEVPARTGETTSCAATPPVAQPTMNTMAMIQLCFMGADDSWTASRVGNDPTPETLPRHGRVTAAARRRATLA